ncbi:hypothetical protein GCM10020295_76640 [Streptomyces cinereospinus]
MRQTRPAPKTSANCPPSSRKPAKKTAYALTIHCGATAEKWRLVPMSGSATQRIEKSSANSSWAPADAVSKRAPCVETAETGTAGQPPWVDGSAQGDSRRPGLRAARRTRAHPAYGMGSRL